MEKILTEIVATASKIKLKFKLIFLPRERRLYVVREGTYKGEWLVLINRGAGINIFFSLPDKQERIINDKDLTLGLNKNIVEIVDVLPKGVYNVCKAEYENAKRSNTLDRREQRPSSRKLGRERVQNLINELQRARDRNPVYVSKDN